MNILPLCLQRLNVYSFSSRKQAMAEATEEDTVVTVESAHTVDMEVILFRSQKSVYN